MTLWTRSALARAGSSPVRLETALSVGEGAALAQLIDGLPQKTGIVCQLHTDKGPFKGLLTLSARESTQRCGGQSSPHSAPTRPDITVVVKAGADLDASGLGLDRCRDSPGAQLPLFEGEHSCHGHPALEHTGTSALGLMGAVSPWLTDSVSSLSSTKPDWPPMT